MLLAYEQLPTRSVLRAVRCNEPGRNQNSRLGSWRLGADRCLVPDKGRSGLEEVTHPNKRGHWWSKGAGPNADLGWQMFVCDVDQTTRRLVVRLSGALHTRHPWFTPKPDRWKQWTLVPEPGATIYSEHTELMARKLRLRR